MKKYVIVVAAGAGTRMESAIPKQFLLLNGLPIVMHAINKFHAVVEGIETILVLSENYFTQWEELKKQYDFTIPVKTVAGGETRFHSVRNGLQCLNEQGIVAIHDAVRPFVNTKTIIAAFKAAEMYGNAVPAIPLNDSIRKIESGKSIAVDRSRYCIVQTPQCFDTNVITKAYKKDYKFNFTDDATVVESCGEKIHLIDGSTENIKITTPMDMLIAEAMLNNAATASK